MSKTLPTVLLVLTGIALIAVVLSGGADTPQLELRRWGAITADDGFAFDMTNVDHHTVKITAMTINDRKDCSAKPISLAGPGTMPMDLKVGRQGHRHHDLPRNPRRSRNRSWRGGVFVLRSSSEHCYRANLLVSAVLTNAVR